VAIALAHINRPPPPLPADIPPAVRLLVERALAKDPADRFPDGAAFAEAVQRVAAGGSPTGAALRAAPLAPATAPTRVVDMNDGATQMLPATGAAAAAATAGRPMPPLAAGEEDDDYLDDEPAPADGNRRRWLWVLLAVLLAALLGLAAWALLRPEDGTTSEEPPASTSASAPSSAATVQFDPTAWIGEDYREAQAALDGQGLSVTTQPATEDQLAAADLELAPGGVAATDPSTAGPLQEGAAVVLYFAEDGYVPGGGEEEEPEEPAPTTEAPASTSEEPEPTTEEPAPTTETTAPSSESSAATSTAPTTAAGTSVAPTTSVEPTAPEEGAVGEDDETGGGGAPVAPGESAG
jgi:eukaryotic-like serine/threonine-protein kinase